MVLVNGRRLASRMERIGNSVPILDQYLFWNLVALRQYLIKRDIRPPRRPGTIPYRALVPRLSRQMVLVNGMGLAWLLPMQGQSNSSCNLGCRSAWPERHAVWCISKGLVNCFQIGRLATHWHIGTGLDRIGQDWQIGELVLQWKIDL